MVSSPRNLESDFNGLCINPERKSRMRSRSFSHFPRYLVKRRRLAVPASRCCFSKINLYSTSQNHVIRPAKLKLPNGVAKSTLIRPAKLNLQNTKLFLLKPPTLLLPDSTDKLKKKKSRFSAPAALVSTQVTLVSAPATLVSPPAVLASAPAVLASAPAVLASAPAVLESAPAVLASATAAAGKVFDDKSLSQANFKSLVSAEDGEIIKAFDTLSFRQLRSPMQPAAEMADCAPSKRESSSSNSCSVQARMESTVAPDCDDTSIDELASYFDLFVHIPKKMSSMAEMMYI